MKKTLQVLHGKPSSPPPFWFMRQAGRYLPEYQQVRAQAGSFLNLCFNPELAAEVTLQPLHRYGMDAAILFADILLIPLALGQDLRFETGEGPKLGKLDVTELNFDETKLQPIYKTLNILSAELNKTPTTLIGFAGAPWTVATYMIEGGSSRSFTKAKSYSQIEGLLEILVISTSQYLISQINAGAEVVQIFDSWASALSSDEFQKYCIEPTAQIVQNIRAKHPHTPIIGFPKGAQNLASYVEQTKVNAISIDSSVNLEWAFNNLNCAIQGNLDPQILLESPQEIKIAAERILKISQNKKFIFNLAHGIDKHTKPENVEFLSKLIKQNL